MTDPLGYYKILGADLDVNEQALKLKYRDQAKVWHPDYNKAENALETFQKISEAYDVLSDTHSRLVYDLLSLVYSEKDFPDMKTLKIYKSAHGDETPFLRVFKLKKVHAGLRKQGIEEENLVGTYQDAKGFVKSVMMHNLLKGWWSPKGFKYTVQALKDNYKNINMNRQDNFKMLVHNGAAFFAEGKNNLAYLSLVQAFEYCPSHLCEPLKIYMRQFTPVSADMDQWDFDELQKIQLLPLKVLGGVLVVGALIFGGSLISFESSSSENKAIAYYQEVRFNNGMETVDDVVVSKVFNIPVDVTDTKMLYYAIDEVNVMYGPSEDFDKITRLRLRQTVRVTGYTPDQKWFRIMLDNGEMGFVEKNYLKAGVGRDIPSGSKIFHNPALDL